MTDRRHMTRALELAARAQGSVSPRPPVGCVLVDDPGRVVGEGYTRTSPGPHAEAVALQQAGGKAKGTTAYVTLEPCAHTGATPPCAEALIAAGVRRVVVGTMDPHSRVRGRGLRALRRAGIEVRTGVLRSAAKELIQPFAHWAATGRPLVTLKLAATLDGRTAAPDGSSRWITGPGARSEVHELRRRVDAVAVGAGTVETDDPSLTSRLDAEDVTQPLRVVLDSSGRTPATAKVFDGAAPALVLTSEEASNRIVGAWQERGARVLRLPREEAGVSIPDALAAIGELGVCHLLVEGGPTLAGSFLSQAAVDRLLLYLAPKLLGGDAPGLLASGVKTLADAWQLEIDRVVRCGEDIRIEARPSLPGGVG